MPTIVMAIRTPFSNRDKNNLKEFIVVCEMKFCFDIVVGL